jgi:hypothetical protein
MRVNWVVADSTIVHPGIDINILKNIASIWGSWKTWRSCSTDNVICSDRGKIQDLLKRNMQTMCNMYIPDSLWVELNRPEVKLFAGEFKFEIDNPDELIALQLVSNQSDVVLLLGFDWAEKPVSTDKLIAHRAHNYYRFVKDTVSSNPDVQWVLVDHNSEIMPELAQFENLTVDTLDNVIELLTS